MRLQLVALATVAFTTLPAGAATPPPVATKAKAAKTAAALDPDAAAALDRMGAYLRSLKTFEVTSDNTMEEVLGNGQKLQFLNRVRYVVNGPDKLYSEIRNDRRDIRLFYDGKALTVENAATGFYAVAPMTGTIGDLLRKADEQYGIELPLQDLFRWGSKTASTVAPKEGFKVGPARIGAFTTDHYAFRQDDVDFQIFIEQGDKPLPRKLVITTLTDPAQPQYVAYFTWNTEPKVEPQRFTFVPGKNSAKIPFATSVAAAAK
jgi:hypothetical protein